MTMVKKNKIVILCAFLISAVFGGAYAQEGDNSEMDRYREILSRPVALNSDVVDLTLMQKGRYAGNLSATEKLKIFSEISGLSDLSPEDLGQEASRGFVSKTLLESFYLKEGLFYWLTRWERYAIRDVQSAQIMKSGYSQWSRLSGSQLIGVFNRAVEVAALREGKKDSTEETDTFQQEEKDKHEESSEKQDSTGGSKNENKQDNQ